MEIRKSKNKIRNFVSGKIHCFDIPLRLKNSTVTKLEILFPR